MKIQYPCSVMHEDTVDIYNPFGARYNNPFQWAKSPKKPSEEVRFLKFGT